MTFFKNKTIQGCHQIKEVREIKENPGNLDTIRENQGKKIDLVKNQGKNAFQCVMYDKYFSFSGY